ncbi:MAG: hypothetical protein RRZ24_02365 [Clostridia bacterium]
MRSIIEEIAEAELKAEEIRSSAVTKARDAIATAKEQAEKECATLIVNEREKTRDALEKSERNGEQITREMTEAMAHEADALCLKATACMSKTVDYLLKKVQETA